MPALISHYLHASRALDAYRKAGGAPADRDAFLWGAQGPDFLFCQIPFPWRGTRDLRALGLRLHKENPVPFLTAVRDFSAQNPGDNLARSYLLGLLCHYSFDRTAHPFVYAQVASLKTLYPTSANHFLHCQIETSLDVILLRYERAELPTEVRLKIAYPKNRTAQDKIGEIYHFTFQRLYGREIGAEAVLQAERDCRLLTGLQNDRTGLKKQFFQHFDKKKGKCRGSCVFRGIMEDEEFDYANVLASPWCWPPDSPQQRTDSFLELYEASVLESARFMEQIYIIPDLDSLIGDVPFS